jgi:hypothetical protein
MLIFLSDINNQPKVAVYEFLLGPPANNDLDLLLCIQDFLRFQLDQSSNLAPKFNLLLWAEQGVSAHLIEVALNVGV